MPLKREPAPYEVNSWKHWTEVPKGIKDYWWYVAELRPSHPDYELYQSYDLLQCPYCKFKNVHQKSVDHHMKYTHIPGHPSPPNEVIPTMSQKDISDWEDTMKGRKSRRSGLRVLGD